MRAAIVIPATFAVSLLVIRNLQTATFAVFGCFALLVMSDFGGRRLARTGAYLGATLTGAALLTLGTAVSPNIALGSALMLVVGFIVSFAGVFGGYLTAGQTGQLLAFVLAVAIPGTVSDIPARLAGWALAGAVSTLAGVFLWPWFERVMLREMAAEACRAVADLVDAMRLRTADGALDRFRSAVEATVRALHREYTRTKQRPAGPARRDRAFVQLVTQLDEIVDLGERPFHEERPSTRPCIDETTRLAATVTAALRASADALTADARPNVRAIHDARRAHRAALDRWAAEQLQAGRPAEEVLSGIDVDHTLRVVSYISIALGENAVIAAGGQPDDSFSVPASIPRRAGFLGLVLRTAGTARAQLAPSSTVLHGSLRVAVGLALSVLLARVLGLSHAFWVVLGTLSVLRSNALGTGRTTMQALLGTIIGFLVGGLFALVAGSNPIIMWIALPIALFLASYAAGAIGFVAGQAAFTLMVIVIFNLISPAGWQVGLVRIEDVALGTGVSVVVSILLWPSGARRDFARSIASLYRSLIEYLGPAFALVLGMEEHAADLTSIRAEVVRARERAGEAFDSLLNERGAKPFDAQTAGRLVSAGSQALLAGDLLTVVAADLESGANTCADGAAAVDAQVQVLMAGLRQIANELAGELRSTQLSTRPSADALRAAAMDCLCSAGGGERAVRDAMAVVIATEWVQNLVRLQADIAEPVKTATDAARVAWWR